MECPRWATDKGRYSRSQGFVDINIFPFRGELGLESTFEGELVCEVTGSKVTRTIFLRCRHLFFAYLLGIRAARMERTAAGWVGWAGNLAFEDDGLHHFVRIQRRDRRHERFGVRMQRLVE